MAIADVNGDPLPVTFFPVVEKSFGCERAFEQSCLAEDVRGGSRAIVAAVIVPSMAATPFVGLSLEAVSGRDGALYGRRSFAWCVCDPVLEHGRPTVVEAVGDGLPGFDLIRAGSRKADDGEDQQQEDG